MLYAPSYDDGSSVRIARASGTVAMASVCGAAESEKRLIIVCPHCHAALDIADKQIGERVHHARCNNWSMVGQHADGTLYGVKVQPPITMPARQRTQR